MIISIGSDHRGYSLKEELKKSIEMQGHTVTDVGCFSEESCDYPDLAQGVAQSVSDGKTDRGILICGTGIGMSIAANRFSYVRAALCYTEEAAQLSRAHNNSNILVLGAKYVSPDQATVILKVWLETEFEQGRHAKRLSLIDKKYTNC